MPMVSQLIFSKQHASGELHADLCTELSAPASLEIFCRALTKNYSLVVVEDMLHALCPVLPLSVNDIGEPLIDSLTLMELLPTV